MAGLGERFVKKGYTEPKPLIKVNNKRIIEYIVKSFSPEDEFIFICNNSHLKNTDIFKVLNELVDKCTIVGIPDHKLGPVHTVSQVLSRIKDDEEIIVCYCDNPFIWDRDDFINHISKNSLDGCILTHSGFHPHTLNKTKMAFIKEDNGSVLEIKEKECYTENPMQEHASTGLYYFKKGKYVKEYFTELINKNINYNGEFYVTLVYNLLIEKNLKVGYYDTPFVTVFGTPEEVENFESWVKIINGGQINSEQDLIDCYNYWKNYHSLK